MAENLSINAGSKEEKYRELLPQLYALISTETDFIANLANLSLVSVLAEEFAARPGKKHIR